MVAAEPLVMPNPADTIQAAPILAIEALCFNLCSPFFTKFTMFKATTLPDTPDGIPVRGGAGKIAVPFLLFIGFEMECGGAKAIPGANMFG